MYDQAIQKKLYERTKSLLGGADSEAQPGQLVVELRELIEFHEWKYYVQNDPVISDFEYDTLYKKLEALEVQNPKLIHPDSPTQRVGKDLTDDFPTVAHNVPMLSLDNSYNADDLIDFNKQIIKLAALEERTEITYCVEPKFDGGSIALVYENDRLTRGATRGNGEKGDDITPNARVMRSIPLKALFSKYKIAKTELRGEVLIRKDNFDKINEQRTAAGLPVLANPRNSAAGGLRVKDPNEVEKRHLEAFVYQLGYGVDKDGVDVMPQFSTHYEMIELLGELGFKVPQKEKKRCKNIEEVIEFCAGWQEKRDSYPYEIDGMVVKVDSIEIQKKCGFTSHHPRWAIAYKFKAKQATTKLLNVEYQVGKVGSITPVAKVEPVQLAGVTVSSISLHNEDFITNKDLRLGDTILIERAGDVIPYVVKSMPDLRDGSEQIIEFPKTCPFSKEQPVQLVRSENEAAWRCPDCNCGSQQMQRIIFHISKDAMDIDGFGKSYVERFYELGWLKTMADVYNLDYNAIAALEGFGEKSASKLKVAIDKAKQNPIHRLLHGLSIHHLGKKASKLIAEQIGHVLELKNWTLEDFTDIKDIGPVVAENIITYFESSSKVELLESMERYGVNLTQTEEDKPLEIADDAPLYGKSILFTGTLVKMGRKEAQEKATLAGAKNISAVSKKLDILVAGEKAGSKLKKAQALGTVQIMTEEDFISLIENA